MKLSKLAEALSEGWYAYRTTLSAKPRHKTMMYYQGDRPRYPFTGDIWVLHPGTQTFVWTGFRWKEIEHNARFK